MKWLKTSTSSLQSTIQEQIKTQVSVEVTKSSTTVTLTFKDYLYSQLKESLSQAAKIIQNSKAKKPLLVVSLPASDVVMYINPLKDNSILVVDLLESVKARVPSARSLTVSLNEIKFSVSDFGLVPKTVAGIGVMLADHFSEDLTDPITVSVKINDRLTIKYYFKLIDTDSINLTIVNSNRYAMLMEFLLVTPHPEVDMFKFEFRDVNKGYFATMNLAFKNQLSPREEYEISNFVRTKLNSEFSHLSLY